MLLETLAAINWHIFNGLTEVRNGVLGVALHLLRRTAELGRTGLCTHEILAGCAHLSILQLSKVLFKICKLLLVVELISLKF